MWTLGVLQGNEIPQMENKVNPFNSGKIDVLPDAFRAASDEVSSQQPVKRLDLATTVL